MLLAGATADGNSPYSAPVLRRDLTPVGSWGLLGLLGSGLNI